MPTITKITFDFLKDLKKNNNRDWFQENKKRYQDSHNELEVLAEELMDLVNRFDALEEVQPKKTLFRIYRDVRFSKNKEPYKTNRSGYFARKGAERRGAYYFSIEPGNTHIGGGFYQPEAADLNHIRSQIDLQAESLKEVIMQKKLKETFGELLGEKLKTQPRGFEKDHPEIELLRHKGFYFMKSYKDAEVMKEDFPKKVASDFKILMPFLEVMTDYLTTDLNGAPLV